MMDGTLRFHQKQAAFFVAEAPVNIALSGIRGGKTFVGAAKCEMRAMRDPCDVDEFHIVCSPTYQMSKVPVQMIFKHLYDKTIFPECPLIKYHKSDRVFELVAQGGTTKIMVCSLHDPDRIRGIKAKSAWVDEGAYVSKYAWDVVLGRLADTNGLCDVTTTPAGYNFIHEYYQKAVEEKRKGIPLAEREVRFFHWTSFDNIYLDMTAFKRLKRQYDARTADQELRALFVRAAGRIYHGFTRRRNVRPWTFQRHHEIIVGQDFNVANMATVFMQPFKPDGWAPGEGLHIFDERLKENTNTHELAHYLGEWCKARNVQRQQLRIVPDASGSARSTTGKSDHQILREAGFRVKAPKKNPFVKDRINCVNGLLDPDEDKQRFAPRLMIDPSCTHAIETMEHHLYKEDSDPPEPDKESGLDHIGDAIGYPCWQRFPLRLSMKVAKGNGGPHGYNGPKRQAA